MKSDVKIEAARLLRELSIKSRNLLQVLSKKFKQAQVSIKRCKTIQRKRII